MSNKNALERIEGIVATVVRATVVELLQPLREQLNQVQDRLTEVTDTFNNRRGRIERAQLDAGLSVGFRLDVSLISTKKPGLNLLSLELRTEKPNDLAALLLEELTDEADWPFLICEPRQALSEGKRALCPIIVNQVKGKECLILGKITYTIF
jgi:hypothetical protein